MDGWFRPIIYLLGFGPANFQGPTCCLPHTEVINTNLNSVFRMTKAATKVLGKGWVYTPWDGNFCRQLFAKYLKKGEALREWLILDTFFFVRILHMFIISIFWYYDIAWWEALLNKRQVEFDGMELLLKIARGSTLWVTVSALDQFGHSWDGPSLYKKLQYFRAGQTSAASTNLTISVLVYYQQPFFESLSSCGKKSQVFLHVWNVSLFQCE